MGQNIPHRRDNTVFAHIVNSDRADVCDVEGSIICQIELHFPFSIAVLVTEFFFEGEDIVDVWKRGLPTWLLALIGLVVLGAIALVTVLVLRG